MLHGYYREKLHVGHFLERQLINNDMQCRSKNITCAFLVTAHIVHKAVVVSLRKIFWRNGFIIFITGKSSTKLHVTLF